MKQRHHCANGELQLKAHGYVKHHGCQRHQHAQAALVSQLLTDGRPNKLRAAQGNTLTGSARQHLENFVTQGRILFGVKVLLRRHTHQNIALRAKILHHMATEARSIQLSANVAGLYRFFIDHFHQRAAGKIQPPFHLVEHQCQ